MQMLFVKEDSDGDSNDLPSFTEKINSASSMLPPSDDLNLALPTSIDQSILVCYFESFHTTFNSWRVGGAVVSRRSLRIYWCVWIVRWQWRTILIVKGHWLNDP